jgi:tetratricopeptide (TPR) repeat protein
MTASYYFHKKNLYKKRIDILICFFLILITICIYSQVKDHSFIEYDDDRYVTENINVQKGLTKNSIIWAFKSTIVSNWHPFTWLSHMLDAKIYGLKSGGHHVSNVLFHILNSILLFIVFRRMTGNVWQSGFVAALFALHPLHVESVAWIAERKDVLSTFFWVLTMCSYALYAERSKRSMYLLSLLFFMLGLMSKPMLVTLPFVLLQLDYWPLRRFKFRDQNGSLITHKKQVIISLIREKIPFFILSATSCVITFLIQKKGGAIGSLDVFTLKARIANTIVSYAGYIGKMFWPAKLSVFYPHPSVLPVWKITGACFLLVSISFLVIKYSRKYPWFAVGWLWYLGTLVPVIGLIQIGTQAMADRYTYIPLIGLFIMIAWSFPENLSKWRYKRITTIPIAVSVLSILAVITWFQVRYWKDSIALFKHALEVTENNYVVHNNLGFALKEKGRVDEAVNHYSEALRINPDFELAHLNLGVVYAGRGDNKAAIKHYKEALRVKPDFITAYINMGNVRLRQGRIADAISYYSEALRLNPDSAQAYNGLGAVMIRTGRIEKAIEFFQKALQLKPGYKEAENNLKNTLAAAKK